MGVTPTSTPVIPEASSTKQALQRALVGVIITLLNDSERLLNKKWLRPVTNKSNPPIGWKSIRKLFFWYTLLTKVLIIESLQNSLDPDQARRFVGSKLFAKVISRQK